MKVGRGEVEGGLGRVGVEGRVEGGLEGGRWKVRDRRKALAGARLEGPFWSSPRTSFVCFWKQRLHPRSQGNGTCKLAAHLGNCGECLL